VTRFSQAFLPTLKEAPSDAEALSHKLMVRAGLIRQVGAGLWSYLPAGWRVERKVEAVIREEMEGIGAQEMLMPVLQPAEPWEKTGRYAIEELFKLEDRKGSPMVLAMTHEECVTHHVAKEVRSYRDLPLTVFQIQTKERDEPRPRAGVLRTREFTMKDAYSFDRDEEGLVRSYELQAGAYSNAAGVFTPFYLKLARNDSEQEITHFSIKLPPGVIGKLAGGVDFSQLAVVLEPARMGADGKEIAAVLLRYGHFIQTILDFVLVAFAVFLFVKVINKLYRKREEAPAPAAPAADIVLLTEIRDALRAPR